MRIEICWDSFSNNLCVSCNEFSYGGIRTRGGRGFKQGTFSRYKRYDNNFFTVLGDLDEDNIQDGGVQACLHLCRETMIGLYPYVGNSLSVRESVAGGGGGAERSY